MSSIQVISLGGSIIAPREVDVGFLQNFFQIISAYLGEFPGRKLIIVCGGGAPARLYQAAYREFAPPKWV